MRFTRVLITVFHVYRLYFLLKGPDDWSDSEDENAPPEAHANLDRLVSSDKKFSIVFNDQISVPVERNLVETLRKMRTTGHVDYSQLKGLERNVMQFLLTREDRLARRALTKWRSYKNPEKFYKQQRLRLKLEPPRKLMLPWYFVVIPWTFVSVTTACCGFFTILYTFNFGADKSLKWLRSFLLTVLGDVLLTEPLNVIGFAVFFSVMLRKNDLQRFDVKVEKKSDIAPFNIRAIFAERIAVKILRQNAVYEPPTQVSQQILLHLQCVSLCNMYVYFL